MAKNDEFTSLKDECDGIFQQVHTKIKSYLDGIKKRSSDEILTGSISEAQKLLTQIEPIENAYRGLEEAQKDFLKRIEGIKVPSTSDAPKESAPKSEKVSDDVTPPENFRIPILKALIYLGGSAKVEDVTEFIERDMKKKFLVGDHEIDEASKEKRWIAAIKKEKAEMTKMSLLSNESEDDYWEIVQKGIDYLAKHGK